MRKSEIEIGRVYAAKVSGRIVPVRILCYTPWGTGWPGRNLKTGRDVHIKSGQKLRYQMKQDAEGVWR